MLLVQYNLILINAMTAGFSYKYYSCPLPFIPRNEPRYRTTQSAASYLTHC